MMMRMGFRRMLSRMVPVRAVFECHVDLRAEAQPQC